MSDRSDFIADKLSGFLARRSVPRHLKGQPELVSAESDGLIKTVLRYAPTQGLEEWWETFEEHLLRRMKTQTWPIVSEVETACQAATQSRNPEGRVEIDEARKLAWMTEWFEKFKNQAPGVGSAARTATLIQRGILADEREARFRGFTLSTEQNERALSQRMGRDEWDHHVRTMARLKNQTIEETDWQERIALSADQIPLHLVAREAG